MWSGATPTFSHISAASLSSVNTVTWMRSFSSLRTSVENSYAQAHISFLKYLPNEKLPSISKNDR